LVTVVRVIAPMPEPAEADEARFALTACYAAGRCQGDLCCPVRDRCSTNQYPGDDDEYDD
jgi:hypothetical protein